MLSEVADGDVRCDLSAKMYPLGNGYREVLTDVSIGRFTQGLQKVRHTPMQIMQLELFTIVCRHTGNKGDDLFPDCNFLVVSEFQCQLTQRSIKFRHDLSTWLASY